LVSIGADRGSESGPGRGVRPCRAISKLACDFHQAPSHFSANCEGDKVGSENYYADKSCADRSDQDRACGDIFGSFDPRVKFRGGHVAQRFEGGVESLSTPYGSDCENDGKPLDSAYSDRKSERDNDDRRERVYARVGFGSEHLADSTECVTKCLDTIFFVKTHLD
jgi:hypothetical protein